MTQVIARHTIHRPAKAGKGQEVIKPGRPFEASGKELERLRREGAIDEPMDAPEAEPEVPAAAGSSKARGGAKGGNA